MKTKLFLTLLIAALFSFSSCKKTTVADETVTYRVTLSNPDRTASITYYNETGGQDMAIVNTPSFTQSFTIKSNATKKTFALTLSCYSKYVTGSSTSFQPQTVTVDILEDDKVMKTITRSGSSSIYIYSSEISASLPTATKYK